MCPHRSVVLPGSAKESSWVIIIVTVGCQPSQTEVGNLGHRVVWEIVEFRCRAIISFLHAKKY